MKQDNIIKLTGGIEDVYKRANQYFALVYLSPEGHNDNGKSTPLEVLITEEQYTKYHRILNSPDKFVEVSAELEFKIKKVP